MYYSKYKYDRYYFDQLDRSMEFNGSYNCSSIRLSNNQDSLVKTDELVILFIVFSLWAWAIGLFIHRWGKIRSIPYIPSFDAVQREIEEKMKKERLSELVTDVQQAFLSSRRTSVYPERISNRSNSFKKNAERKQNSFSAFHYDRSCSQMNVPWRENSSASAGPCQPLRRFSSFQAKRRAMAPFNTSRRYSYDTKLLSNIKSSFLNNGSPNSNIFARSSAWQSQVENTIDEDVESIANSSLVLTYKPKYDLVSSLTTLKSSGLEMIDETRVIRNGNIVSASSRFSDV